MYNECRRGLTTTTKRLASTEIVIDRMHFRGHIDVWCKETCDPSKFKELDNVSILYMYMYMYMCFGSRAFSLLVFSLSSKLCTSICIYSTDQRQGILRLRFDRGSASYEPRLK